MENISKISFLFFIGGLIDSAIKYVTSFPSLGIANVFTDPEIIVALTTITSIVIIFVYLVIKITQYKK